jgi:hypothetical protein
MYISAFYVLTQGFAGNKKVMACAKKTKKTSGKGLFIIDFVFYIGLIKSQFFLKRLHENV